MSALAITGDIPAITTAPDAIAKRDALLAGSVAISSVKTQADYEKAGELVAELKRLERDVEKSRKDIKAPVLELGRKIDTIADEFTSGVKAEVARVGRMLVAWSQEQARLRAEAERKAREEAERIERARREAEAAEARRLAEIQAEQERIEREAREAQQRAKATQDAAAKAEAEAKAWAALEATQKAEEAQREANLAALTAKPVAPAVVVPVPPPKVAGLRLREKQCHEVEDVVALYKARPDLVQLVPIRGAINAALEAGETLPGVRAWKEGRA